MRYSNRPTAAAGTLRVNAFSLRKTVLLVAACAVFVWTSIAFAQEAYISHKLSVQVSELHRQNAQIAGQNAGYKKDVQALSSGSADEEEARLSGFARPNERTYLVTAPSPSPSAASAAASKTH